MQSFTIFATLISLLLLLLQLVFGIERSHSDLNSVLISLAELKNLSISSATFPSIKTYPDFPKGLLPCEVQTNSTKDNLQWFYEGLPISHSDPEFRYLKFKNGRKDLQFRHKFLKTTLDKVKHAGLYSCTLINESTEEMEVLSMYEVTLSSLIQRDLAISLDHQQSENCFEIASDGNVEMNSLINCGFISSEYVSSMFNYDGKTVELGDRSLVFNMKNSTEAGFTFAVLGYSNAFFLRINYLERTANEFVEVENSLVFQRGFLDSVIAVSKNWGSFHNYLTGAGCFLAIIAITILVLILVWVTVKQRKKSSKVSEAWKDAQIIDKQDLFNIKSIGEGAFGSVFKAELRSKSSRQGKMVAVKELHQGFTDNYEILQEIKVLLKVAKHQNVLHLVGFCVNPDTRKPVAIVTEFCAKGCLSSFLQNESNDIYLSILVKIIRQVIDGMVHLETHKFVHRDLAARNVFLTSDDVVKIGDFGLTKDIQYVDYYKMTTSGLMPYKWMAPECIMERKFTSKGDVWSFGVLIWEIFTFASDPYPDISSRDYCTAILNGYRLEQPSNCPGNIYDLVESCWILDFEERPSFSQLRKLFSKITFTDALLKCDPQEFDPEDYMSYINHGLVTTPAQTSIGFFNQSYCRSGTGVYQSHRYRADSLLSNTSSQQDYKPKGYYNLSPTKFLNTSISEQSTLREDSLPVDPQNRGTLEWEEVATGIYFFGEG